MPMQLLSELAKDGKINENAGIKDRHSIIINTPVKKVWALIEAIENWPDWNSVVKRISIDGDVEEGTEFTWNLNGTKIDSQVERLQVQNILSCTGRSRWIKSIFVWQVESDDDQTIVTLSVSMQGLFSTFFKSHQNVYNDILGWLECLKTKAEEN